MLLFNCSHGEDAPERATLPFVAANVAVASGQRAAVVCTVDAAWLGTVGGPDDIRSDGLPPLKDLYDTFVGAGGEVWLCSACTKPRGIDETHLAPGARIVAAAFIVEQLTLGAQAVSFA